MRFAVLALGLASASCYSPSAPSGAPCGPGGECPTGQTCVGGICGGAGEIDAALAPDAPDVAIDAPNACAAGDDVCLMSCLEDDLDCMTTCGDGRCVGNAGELCTSCEADCKTRTAVCGNAQCDPGESPDCYADCGPTPWQWETLENDLIARINAKRTGGTACGTNQMTIAPALVLSTALRPAAREWSWEIAHHQFTNQQGAACNGRSFGDRQTPADFDAAVYSTGYDTVDMVIANWFAQSGICTSLMSTARTQIAAGVAFDAERGWVVVLE